MNKCWKFIEVIELLPEKFYKKSLEMIKEGWDLISVESIHESGFTLHKSKFKKYE